MGCCYAGSHFPEAEDRSELVIDIVEVPLFQSWKKLTVVSGPELAHVKLILQKGIDGIKRCARLISCKIQVPIHGAHCDFFCFAIGDLQLFSLFLNEIRCSRSSDQNGAFCRICIDGNDGKICSGDFFSEYFSILPPHTFPLPWHQAKFLSSIWFSPD